MNCQLTRLRKVSLRALTFVFAIAAFGGLAGCNSSNAVEETRSQLVGYWKVQNDQKLDVLGIATFYCFNEDGTFTITGYAAGTSYQRVGTWEIEDGNAVVNVKEDKDFVGGTARELKNAVIELEGDELTTDDIGKGTIKLSRSNKEEVAKFAGNLGS